MANVVDGTQAKDLNFDSANDAKTSGFAVTPSAGATVVTGITMQSANDAPDRDPKAILLEGSNDTNVVDFASGTWTKIYQNDAIPSWSDLFPGDDRYKTQTFLFDNVVPYKHYRWTAVHTQGPSTCCMQIAEVQLLGSGAPANVVLPGDQVVASSSNSPGSEGVANAVDGTQAKYLNFDSANDAKTSGFIVTPSVGPTTITGIGLQSANDAPDRDVKTFTIEGSNDTNIVDFASGTWTPIATVDNITPWSTLFAGNDRYQWQYFYFTNKTAFKHYRWTVTHTQGPSTCCMQVAEVQFLAVTSKADCTKAAFVLQPVDTPVLAGNAATFFAAVNGPWPLQWYMDGKPIPGATKATYTTDVITGANTNVYTLQIVGCEASQPVHATVFTPSATKSIGISFGGGGANGAPTYMLTNDIAGIQPQAYWNNATNAIGATADGTALADALTDSDGKASPVTFEFTSNGTWGAGTGSDSHRTHAERSGRCRRSG